MQLAKLDGYKGGVYHKWVVAGRCIVIKAGHWLIGGRQVQPLFNPSAWLHTRAVLKRDIIVTGHSLISQDRWRFLKV